MKWNEGCIKLPICLVLKPTPAGATMRAMCGDWSVHCGARSALDADTQLSEIAWSAGSRGRGSDHYVLQIRRERGTVVPFAMFHYFTPVPPHLLVFFFSVFFPQLDFFYKQNQARLAPPRVVSAQP